MRETKDRTLINIHMRKQKEDIPVSGEEGRSDEFEGQ